MRTKKVFYSIAIAAALASCTAEEMELMSPNAPQQNLSIRPVLGNIELVTGTPSSRLATGEGNLYQPQWQEGDKMGAAIIDQANYTSVADYEAKWKDNVDKKLDPYTNMYKIIQSYGSNANFDYSNGAYYLNADMPLVEGNYLFYAPYNKNMQYRSAMTVKVPAVQDGTTEMGALDEFYNSGSVVRVGYDFLAYNDGKAQRPNLTLFDVFSYPMFTIKNNFKGYLYKKNANGKYEWVKFDGGTVEIDKIALYAMDTEGKTAQEVVLGGSLSHENVKACTELETLNVNWEDKLFENKTVDLLHEEALTKTEEASEHKITEVQIDRNVALKEEINVYAVMPAAHYNSLMAKVYLTIDGKQYVIERKYLNVDEDGELTSVSGSNLKEVLMTSEVGEINLVPGQRYPQEELNWNEDLDNPLSAKKSAGSILTIDLTGGLKAGAQVAIDITKENDTTPTTEYIDNNEEWIEVFSELQNGTALSEYNTTDKTGTEGFIFAKNTEAKLNAEIIKALSTYNNKGTLTLNTALIIDNDVKVVGISGNDVTFAAGDAQYTITLNAPSYIVDSESDEDGTSVKSEAGSLHVVDYIYMHNDETIYNNVYVNEGGHLSVATELDVENLVNYGVIMASATIDGEIINNNYISIEGANVELKIVAGEGYINGNESILTSKVTVIGGNQQGTYISSEGFKYAEEIAELSWVNKFNTQNNSNVILTNDIINSLPNITTYIISGLNFNEASVDLTGKTIEVAANFSTDEQKEVVITGNGTYHTTVTGLNIVNKMTDPTLDVKLSNVKATGTYVVGTVEDVTYGKLYTSDTATWNGKKVKK